ncbi:transcriptional regulator, GntR family [Granulicatella balaenopterae]|uniref:Transcriptional regulator, GntR family n=1 Tax=Granulicatella balaenopterae TaxID=137733 RepID=A0A1H9KTM9_9LACT|nr:PLP-dependent aminotransferase family protein [Granulicatella balaenopterae]SER02544.1 transcriptional regulator, GntR family [Granulicatella balaenopterae]
MKKSEKIVYLLVERLRKGELKKGDKLPSIRQMVEEFHCNKETVQRALAVLKQEQYIYSVEKSGHYVLNDLHKESSSALEETALPSEVQFPLSDFQLCVNEALLSRRNLMIGDKIPSVGIPELLSSLQHLLMEYDVYAKKEQLLVVDRIQQVLYLIVRMVKETPGKKMLIEQPTYHHMNHLVEVLQVPYQVISRTPEGIDLVELERLFSSGEIMCFYTISRLHYPLAGSFSEEEKKRIVALAREYRVMIIEDDYMADFSSGQSAPLHYYDTDNRVVYLKTFSSIMFPSFRLGVVVLPKAWHQQLSYQKELMGYDANYLLQKSLSLYIENGMYHKHQKRLIALYRKKKQVAAMILEQYYPGKVYLQHTMMIFPLKENVSMDCLHQLVQQEANFDLMERAYLAECPYQYLKLDIRLMDVLVIEQQLPTLLAKITDFTQ